MPLPFAPLANTSQGRLCVLSLACAVVLGLAPWSIAHAECRRPIKVPVSQGFGITLDAAQRASGRYGAVLEKLEQQTKCKIEYVPVSRARAWLMFFHGEVDLITTATRTAERDRVGELLVFNSSRIAAISLKTRGAEFGKFDADLSGRYSVNSVRGLDYGPAYTRLTDLLLAQNRLYHVANGRVAMDMLRLGRVDVVLASPVTIWEATEALGISNDLNVSFLDAIPAYDSGIYLSQQSLSTADFAQIKVSLTQESQKKLFWRAFAKEAPAWAMVGASLAN